MKTHSTPSTCAEVTRRSIPRAAFCTDNSPLARIERQSVSEACGSASITRQRRPDICAKAEICAIRVLLPTAPLRDAKVITFIRQSPHWVIAQAYGQYG